MSRTCRNGHEAPDGSRRCQVCDRRSNAIRHRRWYDKHRAAILERQRVARELKTLGW